MTDKFRTVVKGTDVTHNGGPSAKDVGHLGMSQEEAEQSASRANAKAEKMGLSTRYETASLK